MFISWLVYSYFFIPYRTCGDQDKIRKTLHSSRAIIEKTALTAVESNLQVLRA